MLLCIVLCTEATDSRTKCWFLNVVELMLHVLQEKLRVAVLVSKAAFQFISGEFQFIIRFNKVTPWENLNS